MRNRILLALAVLVLVGSCMAQDKHSAVGTWKLDVAQSDFGSAPALKSVTITVLKDTPEMLSWQVHLVDDKGKAMSYSWSGPQDGSMHPVMQDGKEIGKESAKKEADGSLLRHGVDADESTYDGRSKISDDGNTITEELVNKTKDGKETTQKLLYHRSSADKKTADK